jgi:hypothetical protein
VFGPNYAARTRDFVSLRILHIEDPRAVSADHVRFASARRELVACNTTLFRDMCLSSLSKLAYTIYAGDWVRSLEEL